MPEFPLEMASFVAVVEEDGFSRAAERMGLSPSAVSKQVSRLEDRLGARLLNRTTRRIGLTEEGEAFYQRSIRILADIEEAERAVTDHLEAPRGTLRVSASISFGQRQLVPLLPGLMARYPELRIDLVLTDSMVDLVEEGIDVAIRVAAPRDSSLIARRIAVDRRLVCASPSYLADQGRPRTPADLAGHNCLIYGTVSNADWRFDGPAGRETVRVASNFEANSGEAVRDLALAGVGIARLATFLVGDDIAAGRLERLLADYHEPQENVIHAVYPSRRHLSPKVRAFVDTLVEEMGDENTAPA